MTEDSILEEWTWSNLWLPVSTLFLRFWQCGSSFHVVNLLILLIDHVSELAGTRLLQALQRLAAITMSFAHLLASLDGIASTARLVGPWVKNHQERITGGQRN